MVAQVNAACIGGCLATSVVSTHWMHVSILPIGQLNMCLNTIVPGWGGGGEAKLPSVENDWDEDQDCVSHCVFFSPYKFGISRLGTIGRVSHSGI